MILKGPRRLAWRWKADLEVGVLGEGSAGNMGFVGGFIWELPKIRGPNIDT